MHLTKIASKDSMQSLDDAFGTRHQMHTNTEEDWLAKKNPSMSPSTMLKSVDLYIQWDTFGHPDTSHFSGIMRTSNIAPTIRPTMKVH